MEFVKRFADWLNKPYSDDMTALEWFAFVGLVMLLTVVWSGIIRKLTD